MRARRRLLPLIPALTVLVSCFGFWCYRHGFILYYGDAVSHLNNSRSLIDSRTPGYEQLGTPWLPMLHVLCLPFVGNDFLWSTGLAGTIPAACCFVIAGSCFFFAARDWYRSDLAAAVTAACFALNPNILYLAVIPMTESVFFAGLSVLLLAVLRFRSTQHKLWIALAIASSWFTSLTRYDGWFLIPFLALWLALSAPRRRYLTFILITAALSLAPLYWLAHNWWLTNNSLDFYNGPYSAAAIQGSAWYPGYHDWLAAAAYYFTACRLCAGFMLLLVAIAGAYCGYRRHKLQPLLFLLLTPLFYIWSVHSSKLPIHVPPLWPFTYYNTRYGTALIPFCAFAAGASVLCLTPKWKKFSFAIPLLAVLPWLLHPSRQRWICWKESEVNSVDRRAWTESAARFLAAHYRSGQGILTSTGDVGGIYCRARIHLAETINIGNGPLWFAATRRPDLFHPGAWAIMQKDDLLYKALGHAPKPTTYSKILTISTTKFSPDLEIYTRQIP
ncbi:MAG TPA: hypothetical protein VHZ55_16845 [Bryobacteraceae bacterium]|nr:hypothetical protein [Bryobacteraceae bacterium]